MGGVERKLADGGELGRNSGASGNVGCHYNVVGRNEDRLDRKNEIRLQAMLVTLSRRGCSRTVVVQGYWRGAWGWK